MPLPGGDSPVRNTIVCRDVFLLYQIVRCGRACSIAQGASLILALVPDLPICCPCQRLLCRVDESLSARNQPNPSAQVTGVMNIDDANE